MRSIFEGADAVETLIIDRDGLTAGTGFAGPAVVEQFDATTVVPAGWTAAVDAHLNLVLIRTGGGGG